MDEVLVIKDCRAVDERGDRDGLVDIVIEGGRIAEIRSARKAGIPKGAREYPGAGATVVPGLVNMHEHLGNAHPGTLEEEAIAGEDDTARVVRMAGNAQKALRVGVTTLRLVGEKGGLEVRVRDGIEMGLIEGPRIRTAGAPLDFRGGHGGTVGALEGESAEEYGRLAREVIDSGADLLKLMICGGGAGQDLDNVRMPLEDFQAIRAAARQAGLRMALHTAAIDHPIMDVLLDDGVDSLEHCYRLPDHVLERCLAQDILLVMTPLVGRSPEYFQTIRLAPDMVENLNQAGKSHWPAIRKAVEKGARLALGTDFHSHLEFGGTSAPVRELEVYEEAGVEPTALLSLASRNGASWLGLGDQLGLVEEGFLADLLVLEESPLETGASAFRSMRQVIARGQLYETRPPELPPGA